MEQLKVSQIDFFTKPIKYVSGKVDRSGIDTQKEMSKKLGLKASEIYLLGDSEEGFTREYMENIEDIFDSGKHHDHSEINFEDGITEFLLSDTPYGVILKIYTLSQYGEFANFFGNYATMVKLEKVEKKSNEAEDPVIITVTLDEGLVEFLKEEWDIEKEDIKAEVGDKIHKLIEKYYNYKV